MRCINLLVSYRLINREFFLANAPSKKQWREWVNDGIIEGKIIGNAVYVNQFKFASNDIFQISQKQTAVDILLKSA